MIIEWVSSPDPHEVRDALGGIVSWYPGDTSVEVSLSGTASIGFAASAEVSSTRTLTGYIVPPVSGAVLRRAARVEVAGGGLIVVSGRKVREESSPVEQAFALLLLAA